MRYAARDDRVESAAAAGATCATKHRTYAGVEIPKAVHAGAVFEYNSTAPALIELGLFHSLTPCLPLHSPPPYLPPPPRLLRNPTPRSYSSSSSFSHTPAEKFVNYEGYYWLVVPRGKLRRIYGLFLDTVAGHLGVKLYT